MKYGISLILIYLSQLVVADPEIVIHQKSFVDSKAEVFLKDVAEFNNMSVEAMNLLSNVKLGEAPGAGERRTFSNLAVSGILRDSMGRFEKIGEGKLSVKIPNQIIVEGRGFQITEEAVLGQLLEVWRPSCSDCELRVSNISLPKLKLKEGDRWVAMPKPELPKGSFSVPIEVVEESTGEKRNYWIQGKLAIFKKVPVLKRTMNIGERLQADDVFEQSRDVSFATDGVPTLNEVISKRVRQGMRAGDIVFRNSVDRDKAVLRGEIVKISAVETGWEISTTGVAEQDAFVGDTVNVKNPKTNKVMAGVVTSKGEVEIK